MKIRQSAEDYLETILVLSQKKPMIRSIDVVNELGFSKPSVSIAMKNLRENGYISMDREGYITLKPAGREIAEMIYERHIFLSDMLVSLGVDRKTALEDACRIEHVISAESFEAMKRHIQEQRGNTGNAGREKQEGQPRMPSSFTRQENRPGRFCVYKIPSRPVATAGPKKTLR